MHAQSYCNTSLAKTNTIFLCVHAHWIWHLSYTDFTKKRPISADSQKTPSKSVGAVERTRKNSSS